jgi:hypothetical protein
MDESHGTNHLHAALIFTKHVGPMRLSERVADCHDQKGKRNSTSDLLVRQLGHEKADTSHGKDDEECRMACSAIGIDSANRGPRADCERQNEKNSQLPGSDVQISG